MANQADLERAAKGKEVWNTWAGENPGAKVDLSGKSLDLDFQGYCFPGEVDFSGSTFSFSGVFLDAEFCGDAIFRYASFEKLAYFRKTKFPQLCDFQFATFHEGCEFSGTFEGSAMFRNIASKADAVFAFATFNDYADFSGATFSDTVHFSGAEFYGDTLFHRTRFEHWALFGRIKCRFGPDFEGAIFDDRIDLQDALFSTTPNFLNTKLSAIALHDARFEFRDELPGSALKIRRLKSLAIANNDHEMELKFFAAEMRAKREDEMTDPLDKFLSLLYEILSFYGTSLVRPMVGLVTVFVLFFGLYLSVPTAYCPKKTTYLLYLAGDYLLPLPRGSLGNDGFVVQCLYAGLSPLPILWLIKLEQLLGAIFLFLILLAIRNKFRIK